MIGDPWVLIDQWLKVAEEEVDLGVRSAYLHCANMLIEIAGPRAFASQRGVRGE